jgi:hypothetical protein
LGIEIHRDKKHDNLLVSHQKNVENMFLTFGINNLKPKNIPLDSHFKLSLGLCPSNKEYKNYMSCVLYASVVLSLMYVMTCIIPNIS